MFTANKPLIEEACPDLLKEWNYEKNQNIDPSLLTIGSSKKVWWKCVKYGHEWETKIVSRTRENKPAGCLICANQKVLAGFNDLKTRYPDVAELWHPELNKDLQPSQIMPGSQKNRWWLGSCGHEWEATPDNVVRGKRCPYCANRKVLQGFNDLATLYPHVVESWDYAKNGELTPCSVVAKSNKKVWWKCANDHSWEKKVNEQILMKNCPFEVLYTSKNSISKTHPEILKNWLFEKNVDSSVENLTAMSKKSVWWKCNNGHITKKVIKNWVKSGCSLCKSGLAEKHPELRAEWNFEKNDETGHDFDSLLLSSTIKVWWKCLEYGHNYEAVVHSRTRQNASGCPFCSKYAILAGFNDLKTLRPELMKEWDYEKNEKRLLNPSELSCYSTEQVWWKCLNKGHSWATIISARTGKKGNGCPFCSNKQIMPGDNDFATLRKDLLLQWDYAKNSIINILPDQIAPYASTKVWWKCDNGHSYYAAPNVKKDECHKCWNGNVSRDEKKLAEFVEQLIGVDRVVRNDRTVLAPRELDIYIPSLKIAIEYNGVYWHDKKLYLDDLNNNTFHSKEQQKTRDCEILGIYVLHVWEDDWLNDEEQVKEHMRKLLLNV